MKKILRTVKIADELEEYINYNNYNVFSQSEQNIIDKNLLGILEDNQCD